MNIQTVRSVYFSATGTTKQVVTCVAKTAAEFLGSAYQVYSFNLPEARTQTLTFSPEDLVVFGVPVYAGRVPNKLLPFLQEKVVGGGALAVPIVLFGNRNFDDALIELRNIMQQNGFSTIAAGAFVGEHSFSTTLGAGRPDGDDMSLAVKLGQEIAQKVQALESAPSEPVQVAGCEPTRPYYTPRDRQGNPINILNVKPKTDKKKCIGCGLCARVCTMAAINPDHVSEVPGTCIKCCACIKQCPTGAKYYDDEGYLYHRRELEEIYTKRAKVALFFDRCHSD